MKIKSSRFDRTNKELASFLKSCRERLTPNDVGLPCTSRRRTPGLRREEVAALAGVSITWYTWLEQGREIHVSSEVVESLSRVFMLNEDERKYFYKLANQSYTPKDVLNEHISPLLQHVLNNLKYCPSIIINRRWSVCGWNEEAKILFGDYEKMNEREKNILWAMFSDDKYKNMFSDWEKYAKHLIAAFRADYGMNIEDSWNAQLVKDLKNSNPQFKNWWNNHDVDSKCEIYKKIVHPVVGVMEFEVNNFVVADKSDFRMVIHVPIQKSGTEEKMKSLL